MNPTTRDIWRARVEQWKESKLTAAEFAQKHGINANSIKTWKARFVAESRNRTGNELRPLQPAFVEVRLPSLAEQVSVSTSSIELITSQGVRIRVSKDFDEVTLKRILNAVEGR